ncbi:MULTISPECIES: iron-containing alcohol dehydrogenase [Commensalibacter]|uniref:Putative iron-containing alcohol dehydrogenase n=1 Tax=Commensalibacter papalotli (ex Servin-Garciduenas et al. 2014) TaxID=1208583 RepID=W7DZ08_9PROT|nr:MULTISPECIES: iron-containing alcohol dehydrogenase [Commensalibacter]EUK17929.1 putative iron-containing alcohol dehydrogenase [Commensalibacter papalotli (ex Servin-Garciduenas et al. 2014)]CAI3941595.1 Alcohol dehydrogenase YqhD [Commensalibacter papalotli (ex Botero et al. 2024)]
MSVQNFDFCNPTRIIFGKETIQRLNDLIPQDAKVLIIIGGGSVRKNGTLSEVETALGKRHFDVFEGIEANPTFETSMQAVEKIRHDNFNFVLGVGGGSVMDATKFIAGAVKYSGDTWEIITSKGKKVNQVIPFGFVPTLPATGSEMNTNAVISRKTTFDKIGIANPLFSPLFSVIDPTKTYSLPERQVANGVADAFVHVMEQYLTYSVHAAVQDRFAEGLLLTLIEEGPKTLKNPQDYESRANFIWAATMALNGLIGAGVPQDWATHMIGHELTILYGIDHGRTLSILLPSLLNEMRKEKREKLIQYGRRVWGLQGSDEEKIIDEAIAKTRTFFESIGIKTHLKEYDVDSSAVEKVVEQLKRHNLTALGENGDITLEVSRRIVEASL